MLPFDLIAPALLKELFAGSAPVRQSYAENGAAFALKGRKRWKKMRATGLVQMRRRR